MEQAQTDLKAKQGELNEAKTAADAAKTAADEAAKAESDAADAESVAKAALAKWTLSLTGGGALTGASLLPLPQNLGGFGDFDVVDEDVSLFSQVGDAVDAIFIQDVLTFERIDVEGDTLALCGIFAGNARHHQRLPP